MDAAIEARQTHYVNFNIAMIVIPTVAITARFYARYLNASNKGSMSMFWWDDWAVLAALPFSIATNAIDCEMVNLGFGNHIQDVPPENLLPMFTILWASEFTFNTGSALAKASALFFYQRIFSTGHSSAFKWALWITQIMNVLWLIGSWLGIVFSCRPIAKGWDPMLPGHCTTSLNWLGSSIPSATIDVMILVLPLPQLWKLHINMPRKLLLLFTFICGYSIVIISVGRLITLVKNQHEIEKDLTYVALPIFYWYDIEVPLTIVSVCLTILASLGRRVWKNNARPYLSKRYGSFSNAGSSSKFLSSTRKSGSAGSRSDSRYGKHPHVQLKPLASSQDDDRKPRQWSQDESMYDVTCAKDTSGRALDVESGGAISAMPSVHVRNEFRVHSRGAA